MLAAPLAQPLPAAEASTGAVLYESDGWAGQASRSISYGFPWDEPLVGDWDGDGVDTVSIRRGNEVHVNNRVFPATSRVFTWGGAADQVLVGDWDGDGRDGLAIRRGNVLHLKNRMDGSPTERVEVYAGATDEFLVGDWNGDGRDTFGVRRVADFHLQRALGSWVSDVVPYGGPADVPLVGDWNGDGRDTIGVRRGTEYHVTNSLNPPTTHLLMRFGGVLDRAFVGDWDGDGRETIAVRRGGYEPWRVSVSTVTAADLGESWRPGCPVAPSGLRAVSVSFWGYDREPRQGTIVVAAAEAQAVAAAFEDLYRAHFPIHKMYTSDLYGGSDDALVQNDNTSAFLCRTVPGSSTIRQHSYGLAIDINPLGNPGVYSGGIIPIEGAAYANRNQTAPGMIQPNDVVVRAFAARGWVWGGYWTSSKDYQHFSRNGR